MEGITADFEIDEEGRDNFRGFMMLPARCQLSRLQFSSFFFSSGLGADVLGDAKGSLSWVEFFFFSKKKESSCTLA